MSSGDWVMIGGAVLGLVAVVGIFIILLTNPFRSGH